MDTHSHKCNVHLQTWTNQLAHTHNQTVCAFEVIVDAGLVEAESNGI